MIIEVPSQKDFFESGEDYLNSAWNEVIDLISEFKEVVDLIDDDDMLSDDVERYWRSAKQSLISALALVQQSVEFFVKGRIVSVSPYLLISGSPSSWPKKCNINDVEFSEFRTIDAQDLIKVHNTVFPDRLEDQFIQWNDLMRRNRNKTMHTVDKRIQVYPEDVIDSILYVHHYFIGENKWIESRRRYLDNTPVNSMRYIRETTEAEAYLRNSILSELKTVIESLPPSKSKLYFGFDKKAKSTHCPSCYIEVMNMDFFDSSFMDSLAKSYQKDSDGNFKCFVCNYEGSFSSSRCVNECGNYLVDENTKVCTECGETYAI